MPGLQQIERFGARGVDRERVGVVALGRDDGLRLADLVEHVAGHGGCRACGCDTASDELVQPVIDGESEVLLDHRLEQRLCRVNALDAGADGRDLV